MVLSACAPDSIPTPSQPATPTRTITVEPKPAPGTLIVRVGDATFAADVADDTAERAVGLSGRDSLADGAGMWFAYLDEAQRSFWMRGMQFPIDIIWINASLEVVDVTHRAPVPESDTLSDLPIYSPNTPVMYVLEINAGLALERGIEPGTVVTVHE